MKHCTCGECWFCKKRAYQREYMRALRAILKRIKQETPANGK
jgi:hypothetical protein